MKHPTRFYRLASAFLCCISGAGCLFTSGGTEIPDELSGRVYDKNATPAAGVEIRLVPVNHQPISTASEPTGATPVFQGLTGADGSYGFRNVPSGEYNLLGTQGETAFLQDSIAVTGKRQALDADTLRPQGSLAGSVQLQPQHDPRSAVVQVLGTLHFVNVDAEGAFELTGLAPGQYRLMASTSLPGYSPLFREFTILPGSEDTLPEPLSPFYADIPVVTAISASPGPDGTILLSWPPVDYSQLQAYLIYRDDPDAALPSTAPIGRTTDTFFVDTLYRQNPGVGQYPFEDTTLHPVRYRVGILNTTQAVGPTLGAIDAQAIPPTLNLASGRWKRATERAPFALTAHALVAQEFKDSLWVIGYGPEGGFAWVSGNGLDWKRTADSLGFADGLLAYGDRDRTQKRLQCVVFQELLWVMTADWDTTPGRAGGVKNSLWNSADGRQWNRVSDSVSIEPARMDFNLVTFQGRIGMIGGQPWFLGGNWASAVWSADGLAWSDAVGEPNFGQPSVSVAVFEDKLWALGNPEAGEPRMWNPEPDQGMYSSEDGNAWVLENRKPGFLPRERSSLVSHAGQIFVIGGVRTSRDEYLGPLEDAWSSPDGKSWTYVDAHLPFGARQSQSAVSFQGKLWVIGGLNAQETLATDIWYWE